MTRILPKPPQPSPSGRPAMAGGLTRDILKLALGSAYECVGDEPERLSPFRQENVARILKTALIRLGDRVSDPGGVPPRVLECLFGAGSFVDQPIVTEYWGGVLASSRSPRPNDDRAVRWLKLLERLSGQQIRCHFLLYSTLRELCLPVRARRAFDFDSKRYRLATFVPVFGYMAAMGYDDDEIRMLGPLVADTLMGLGAENLLDGSNTGNEKYLKSFFKTEVIRGEGIVFAPSILGISLFLWAFGQGSRHLGHYIEDAFDCRPDSTPPLVTGAALVYDT